MKTLIIVDVQKGFINDNTRHVVDPIEKLQHNYDNVFATRFINLEGSQFRRWIHWSRFSAGTEEVDLAFPLKSTAKVIDKYVYTCVTDGFVDDLKKLGIQEVEICGIDTDVCVSKIATDLFEYNIKPIVLTKYCASHGGVELHTAAVRILQRLIGRDQVVI